MKNVFKIILFKSKKQKHWQHKKNPRKNVKQWAIASHQSYGRSLSTGEELSYQNQYTGDMLKSFIFSFCLEDEPVKELRSPNQREEISTFDLSWNPIN